MTAPVLLLAFDGANGATTFADVTARHTVTGGNGGSGTATLGNSRPKFGLTALELTVAGTSGPYVDITSNLADFDFAAGDFTVEGWFQWDGAATPSWSTSTIASYHKAGSTSGSNVGWEVVISSSGLLNCRAYVGATTYTARVAATTLVTGTTYGFCFMRSGTTLYAFLDGVVGSVTGAIGAGSVNAFASNSGQLRLGTGGGIYNDGFKGMIDELRITPAALYSTAGYTPAIQAFPSTCTATGFSSFNAGTPTGGHVASGFSSFHAGTPTVHATVTCQASGFNAGHRGTPTWRGINRGAAASAGPTFHAGTPTTPTERYTQASGARFFKAGDPVAVIFVPPGLNRVVVPAGARTFHAGTPAVHTTVIEHATGTSFFHVGTPAVHASVTCAATGIATAHAGTPTALRRQHASGVRAFHAGTPKSARVTKVVGSPSHTRVGTPTYTRGAHTHFAVSAGSTFRAGQPRCHIGRVVYGIGFSSFHAGTPTAIQRHRVAPSGPTFRAGTPLVRRNLEC